MSAEADGPVYVALIGDIRGSRELEDRAGVQRRLERVLAQAVREGAEPLSGPTVTTGDEFQALLEDPEGVVPLVVRVTEGMAPVRLRFGVGVGGLQTPVNEDAAIGMDGPCFHRARGALEAAETQSRWLRFRGFGTVRDRAANAIADLAGAIRGDWTDRQREFARAYRELGVQTEVAETFDVAKSTVSESLGAGHVHEVLEAERALSDLLLAAFFEVTRGTEP